MGQMDPAWLAYYQSMSYYSMMQSNMTGATSSNPSTSTTTTKATESTANTSNTNSATPGLEILTNILFSFFNYEHIFYSNKSNHWTTRLQSTMD